jgi:hypothetical protein
MSALKSSTLYFVAGEDNSCGRLGRGCSLDDDRCLFRRAFYSELQGFSFNPSQIFVLLIYVNGALRLNNPLIPTMFSQAPKSAISAESK